MTKGQLRVIRATADMYLRDLKDGVFTSIYDAYKNPSRKKVMQYFQIVHAAKVLPYSTLPSVIWHNCQTFTVAYCYVRNREGKDEAVFVYKTHKNTYTLNLKDSEVPEVLANYRR